MKGYKGFGPGMVCRGKQYAENTVFEEKKAEICGSGMHFCKDPFDVLEHYGFVNENAEINDFAEVESIDEPVTDDNKNFSCEKLRIGEKIGISGLVKAFVNYTIIRIDISNSAATNTGEQSAATNTGRQSIATNTGRQSAASVEGKESFAIATGVDSKARGKLGCYIAVAEWEESDNGYVLVDFKAHKVDGKTIKEDTWYNLIGGEFVEAE